MKEHDATEQAYKNGYEAGVKEFAKFLISKSSRNGILFADDMQEYLREWEKKGV